MNTAARVRLDKEAHPEKYCRVPRCLWRTIVFNGGTAPIIKPCRNHPHANPHAFVRDNQDACHACGQGESAAIHGVWV